MMPRHAPLGVSWPKDITRHTAANYWLALDGNPVHIAEQLGHSVDQLKTHYKALVTCTDEERFWGLIPKADPKRPLSPHPPLATA
jgi:integrase